MYLGSLFAEIFKYYFFLLQASYLYFFGFIVSFLPNTPPPKVGKKVSVAETLGLDALKILSDKNYLVFLFLF
jgi:hypothetical protein